MASLAASVLPAMQGQRVYFDTNLFIYFLEGDERYLPACLPFFQAVQEGEIEGVSGDLVVAELLVKPLRVNDIFAAEQVRALFDAQGYFKTMPHDRQTLELAAHIRATQQLAMVDAIHLATALKSGCTHLLTNDEKLARRAKGLHAVCLQAGA